MMATKEVPVRWPATALMPSAASTWMRGRVRLSWIGHRHSRTSQAAQHIIDGRFPNRLFISAHEPATWGDAIDVRLDLKMIAGHRR